MISIILALALSQQQSGLPTRAFTADSSFVRQTTATATYYVDPTGNNTGACTASGTAACATLSGVFAKLPQRILHDLTITVAAGSYTDAPALNGNEVLANITINGPALINVTPTTGTATGTLTAVANTAPAVLTDSTQSWTVNNFVGRLVTIGGASRVIASNTATTITLASVLASTPSIGAAYSIQRPAATWTVSNSTAVLSLRLSGTSDLYFVTMNRLEFINTSFGDGCFAALTTQFAAFTNTRCYSALSSGITYAGGGQVNSSAATFHGVSYGFYFSPGVRAASGIGSVNMSNGFFYGEGNGGFHADSAGTLGLSGGSGFTAQTNSSAASAGAIEFNLQISRNGTSTAVAVLRCLQAGPAGLMQPSFGTTYPSFFSHDNIYIDGCTTGIDFSQGSGNGNGTAFSSLTCNNVATCIKVANGSRFKVPATWTLTGVTTDIQIDGVNYTKANLTGASPTRLPTAATVLVTPNLTGSTVWQ